MPSRRFVAVWSAGLLLAASGLLLAGQDSKKKKAELELQNTGKAESSKKAPADPELAALQKMLDDLPLAKLRELHATEHNAWTRWRQQSNFGSGCTLAKNFAASPERERELVAKCQAWEQKVRMIERTIKEREKSSVDRQAFEKQLDALPIAKLRELYASESQAYDRWRDQNSLDPVCRLNRRVGTSKEKEAAIVARCQEWQDRIQVIKAAMGRREKPPKEKVADK